MRNFNERQPKPKNLLSLFIFHWFQAGNGKKKITVSFYESVDNTNGKLDYDDVFVSMSVWNVDNKMEAE